MNAVVRRAWLLMRGSAYSVTKSEANDFLSLATGIGRGVKSAMLNGDIFFFTKRIALIRGVFVNCAKLRTPQSEPRAH